jgi:spore germination protein GerM
MTRILSTNINNDTVTLNFSNNFVENLNGTEQIKLKAAQIVYTATQFPGINKVKFTVNNKELKYWGGEGVFTSSVLSRLDVPRIMTIN